MKQRDSQGQMLAPPNGKVLRSGGKCSNDIPVGFHRIMALNSSVYSSSVHGSFKTSSTGATAAFSMEAGSADVVSCGVEAALTLARFLGGICT